MRFANQRIADLVNYIETPHGMRDPGMGDTYFYGQDARSWREDMDALHSDIKNPGIDRGLLRQMLKEDYGIVGEEANLIMNHRGPLPRHVEVGVPHAKTSEEVARLALLGSGIDASPANTGNPMGTDLSIMLDNVNKLVDVQNRYTLGAPSNEDLATLSVLNNLDPKRALNVFKEASPSDTLRTIVAQIGKEQGKGNYGLDKLMQSRKAFEAFEGQKDRRGHLMMPEEKVKDYLIGGNIPVRSFPENYGKRPQQGPYDPQAPRDMEVQDLNKLRSDLLGLSKRDFDKKGGEVHGGASKEGKLKLRIPLNIVREMSKPDQELISREVLEVLNHYAQ